MTDIPQSDRCLQYRPIEWSPTEALVLLCARGTWIEAGRRQAEGVLQQPVQWDHFLNLVRNHQLAPLAHHHLQSLGDLIPGDVQRQLQAEYSANLLANRVRRHALAKVLEAFQERRIPVILWKGVALTQAAYPDIALRAMFDLDLIVPPERADQAIAVLETLGFGLVARTADPGWRSFSPEVVLTGEVAQIPVTIDLHWHAFVGQWLEEVVKGGEQVLWDTARVVDYEGYPALLPAPAPGLLGLILHALLHHNLGMSVLRMLADMDAWIRTYVAPHGWDDLVDQARTLHASTPTFMALVLCQALVSTDIPPAVMGALSASPLRWAVLRRLAPLKGCAYGNLKLSGRHWRFIWQFLLLDKPTDLLKLTWRALFPPRSWLEGRYALDGSSSAFLYHRLVHLYRVILRAEVSQSSGREPP